MSRSAGISWRARLSTAVLALPFLALAGCSGGNDGMAEKLAAAEAAAARAEAAQHAAEKAASAAASIRPAPAPEPAFVADTPSFESDSDEGPSHDEDRSEVSMGGENATVTADGTVVPGRGV